MRRVSIIFAYKVKIIEKHLIIGTKVRYFYPVFFLNNLIKAREEVNSILASVRSNLQQNMQLETLWHSSTHSHNIPDIT